MAKAPPPPTGISLYELARRDDPKPPPEPPQQQKPPSVTPGNLLPPSLRRQKVLPKQPPKQATQPKKPVSTNTKKVVTTEAPPPVLEIAPNLADTAITVDVQDPYDPAQPNDYSEYCMLKEAEMRQQQEQEEAIREMEKEMERERERSMYTGVAIPPPSSLLSADGEPVDIVPSSKANIGEKLLLNMGWKGSGHGLGKNEQGRSAPLMIAKTGANTGVILDEPSMPAYNRPHPDMSKPTKVMLLRNMVGPGEVDDALAPETAEECAKYGRVVKCHIDESTDPRTPEFDAVRTFVLFDTVEAAKRAIVDMHKRFFAGREVYASFYPEDAFHEGRYRLPVD